MTQDQLNKLREALEQALSIINRKKPVGKLTPVEDNQVKPVGKLTPVKEGVK